MIPRSRGLLFLSDMMRIMNLEEIKKRSQVLQQEADELVNKLNLIELLSRLGEVKRVGSSVTGLLLSEDIDFKVYTEHPSGSDAATLANELLSGGMPVTGIEVNDFDKDKRSYYKLTGVYVGLTILTSRRWNVDVIIRKESETPNDERELDDLMRNMSAEQRDAILLLKSHLMEQKRYGGLPKHPAIFTGADVYKAVFKVGAKNIKQLEEYWKSA